MNRQLTNTLLMIRPANFGYNPETGASNTFQQSTGQEEIDVIKRKARAEFDVLVSKLQSNGINIVIVEDTNDPLKSDAVFPNNWFSSHADGSLITYPMLSENRRQERRGDIIEILKEEFGFSKHYHFEQYEEEGRFLEGTGSMILDRVNKIVYACISERTDVTIINKWCILKAYRSCFFHAVSSNTVPVYHTNVIMSLGESYVLVCLDMIKDSEEKLLLMKFFQETEKELIEITEAQVEQFAGNILQVESVEGGRCIIMSENAHQAFSKKQISALELHGKIVSADLNTIEKYGGGSARCMLAEIFYP